MITLPGKGIDTDIEPEMIWMITDLPTGEEGCIVWTLPGPMIITSASRAEVRMWKTLGHNPDEEFYPERRPNKKRKPK